jgi:energy-coupling factor transport system substrate-specific component
MMRIKGLLLPLISVAALLAFTWPLWTSMTEISAELGGTLSVLAAIGLALAVLFVFDGELLGPKQLAMLSLLAALGASLRVATGGTGGFEFVFVAVILGGSVFGIRFGFLLGLLTIALSSLFFGGFGPWTAYQMFATAWVGAGAGWVGKRFPANNLALACYAVVSSYLFGLAMNLWFWPFATGPQSSISFDSAAGVTQNLVSFMSYSLVSSTLTWDTVRAVSVALVIAVFGTALRRTLERAKI